MNIKINKFNLKTATILKELGMPVSLLGYAYTRYAIKLVYDNPTLVSAITKELYPNIAREFNTTPTRVERAIRHAVETAWYRGNAEFQQKLFGYSISVDRGKPTNSELITTIADYIKLTSDENR